MSRLVVTAAAEREYIKALRWYAERSEQAAANFEREFDQLLNLVDGDPHQFPLCDERHRFCLMRRFPYQVIYREHHGLFAVIAVAHAKRKPGYWKDR